MSAFQGLGYDSSNPGSWPGLWNRPPTSGNSRRQFVGHPALNPPKSRVANPEQADIVPHLTFHHIMISLALFLAEGATPQQPNMLMNFLPLIFIFVIFYFLLIRPQQKKQKEHQKLISSLKTGDKVITTAGIHGIITNVKDTTVTVKVAENTKIEFDRAAIITVEKAAEGSEA
jgi:preprotein translocase subunit YajC